MSRTTSAEPVRRGSSGFRLPVLGRVFLTAGALFGFTGVAAGAFGAHVLREQLVPESLDVFETAVRYQLYHAPALVGVAWAMYRVAHGLATAAGWCLLVGTLIFSGSLYALVATGVRMWGMVTPLGGTLLLAGWLLLALAAIRANAEH